MNKQIKYIKYCKKYEEMRNKWIGLHLNIKTKARKKEQDKIWYEQNKEKVLPRHRESARKYYYQKVKGNTILMEERKSYQKQYKNRPEVKRRIREYNQLLEVKERHRERQKQYYQKLKGNKYLMIIRNKYMKKYKKNRIKIDREFAIKTRLRDLLSRGLKHYTKTGKIYSSKKYGINYKAIIEYLKPFPKNISNYQIHHIKPLFTFKFVNPDGSTNLETIKEAFKPENHKLLTIEKHKNINHFELN